MAAWPLLWRYRALCDFAFGGVVLYAFVRFLVSKCAGAVLTVRRPLRELFELASGGSGGAEQLRHRGDLDLGGISFIASLVLWYFSRFYSFWYSVRQIDHLPGCCGRSIRSCGEFRIWGSVLPPFRRFMDGGLVFAIYWQIFPRVRTHTHAT